MKQSKQAKTMKYYLNHAFSSTAFTKYEFSRDSLLNIAKYMLPKWCS